MKWAQFLRGVREADRLDRIYSRLVRHRAREARTDAQRRNAVGCWTVLGLMAVGIVAMSYSAVKAATVKMFTMNRTSRRRGFRSGSVLNSELFAGVEPTLTAGSASLWESHSRAISRLPNQTS